MTQPPTPTHTPEPPTATPTITPTVDQRDDFTGFGYDLWVSPQSPIQDRPAEVGLLVHHIGGQQSRGVTVNFYRGDPNAGGILLGSSNAPLLPPNSSGSTAAVAWTPDSAGEVDLYAVIDPDNQIAETDETNNRVQRTVTVRTPPPDTAPPVVDSLTIDGGAATTANRNVTLAVLAADPGQPASGVSAIYIVEYLLNQDLGIWIPVKMSDGWLAYAATVAAADQPASSDASYAWQLTTAPGLRYLQAWAADRAGNIAAMPKRSYINYTPATLQVGAGAVLLLRYNLNAGDRIDVRVQPVSGDPDIYLWAPDALTLPRAPWFSNLGGAQVDQLSVPAPVGGSYQLEIVGHTAAEFTLTVQITPAGAGRASSSEITGVDPGKGVLTAPLLPLAALPSGYHDLTPPDTAPAGNRIYLPAVQR